MERSTKLLLSLIALGIWINAAVLFLVLLGLGGIENNLDFVRQWLIRGAHITVSGGK